MASYTSEGLPVITDEALGAFLRDINIARSDRKKFEKYTYGIMYRLRNQNPEIAKYITNVTKSLPEEYSGLVSVHMAILYEMLRRQAEVNKLEKSLQE